MKRGAIKFTFVGILLFLLIYSIFFIPNAKSNPDTGITNCTNLTTAGEIYTLSNNIHNDQIASICLNIIAPNVTLDCQGYYISLMQNYSGIYSNSSNTTIKNCNITVGSNTGSADSYGIYLSRSNYSLLFNNSATGGNGYGIYISRSNNVNLTSNTGTSTSGNGIYFYYSNNNSMVNNTAISDSSYAIDLFNSQNNNLTSNIGMSNKYGGFYIEYSTNNSLISNIAISNLSSGINIFISPNCTLKNNNASSSYGFSISGFKISDFPRNVDVANNLIADSSKFYYNHSISNYVFDLTSVPDAGEIFCVNCNNVTIKDLNLSHYNLRGVSFSFTNNSRVQNITSNLNSVGIFLELSFNNTLANNTLNSDSFGISLLNSNNTLIVNNTAISNSGDAIRLFSSCNRNNLTLNTGTSNSSVGIAVRASSTRNNLTLNTGTSNASYGILLSSSSNNILNSNIGVSNSDDGINIDNGDTSNTILINNTGASNLSEGIFIYISPNNTLTSNRGISNSSYGISLLVSSNNTLRSNNVTGSAKGFNVFSWRPTDYLYNDIDTSNIIDGSYKFYYNISVSNYVFDLTSASDAGAVYCAYCTNITIKDLNLSHNNSVGVFLHYTNNSLVQNITSTANEFGIYFFHITNSSITNCTSSNGDSGLYLSESNFTTITNLKAKNNELYGIFIDGGAFYNIIKNSFIQLTNGSAFSLNNSARSPRNNTFYNNYFNNSVQYSNISASSINYFNTTLTLGANIIGGNYLAGNYWAAPNGSGYSQTCTDRGDGICDTAYNFDNVNYDYLPLLCHESWSCGVWGRCNDGKQTRTCTDANLCQTYVSKPVEIQNCQTQLIAIPSSSGGGSSVFAPIVEASPEKPIEVLINNSNMDLNTISLNVKKEISNSSITITKLNETNESKTGLPIGKLYQAFEIHLSEISSLEVVNATLSFRINKTWLSENNITFHSRGSNFWLIQNDIVGNIKLYRNPNGNKNWTSLSTRFLTGDNQFYYFSSYSPGFSTFAIFFNKYDCLPNSARCADNQVQLCLGNSTWLVTETCSDVCKSGKCESFFFKSNQFYIVLVTVIVGIIAITLIVLVSKIKRKKVYRPYSSL
jgi:PGF-pre-PGF domain-containing protein